MLRVEVILEEVESLPGAAIFSKLENDCSIHCRTVVYLSPLLAGKLAGQLGAPCGVPPRKALSLLYGSDDAWALLDVVDL